MIAFSALLKREISRFFKVIVQTVLTPFVSAFLYLLVFGVTLGNHVEMKSGIAYLAYLLPGLMMMGITNNAYQNSSSSIVNAKFTGDLEDLRVAPLNNHTIVTAMCVAALIRGTIVALITYFVGTLFYLYQFNELLLPIHPVYFLIFIALGGLSFGALGISIAFWAKSFDQLSAFSTFVLLPLTYLGGVFISLDKLTGLWHTLASFNPLLYFIEGIRFGLIGISDVDPNHAILVGCISLFFFYIFAIRALKPGTFNRW